MWPNLNEVNSSYVAMTTVLYWSHTNTVHVLQFSQIIEIKGDAVLIKQERVGENKYGAIFKGERICTQDQSE